MSSTTQGWTSGPEKRGSFDILWTCLSTLTLCVWTAVHPNIPVLHMFWSTLLERIGLMVLAIIFPEIIITSAWTQQRAAKRLLSNVNKSITDMDNGSSTQLIPRPHASASQNQRSINEQSQEDSLLPRYVDTESQRRPSNPDPKLQMAPHVASFGSSKSDPASMELWGLEHAMFGVMGGFAMETHYMQKKYGKNTIRGLVTPEGIAILANTGHLPSLDLKDIEERSKADVFAKSVVVIQILWFALQVFGRLGEKLSVTPLETHTAIHVGCAILVYVIWIKKPYNLTQSILLRGSKIDDIGALFNFQDISRNLHRKEFDLYLEKRMEYWKRRVIQASEGASEYDAPPRPPVMKALPRLLDDYRSDSLVQDQWEQDRHILHAITPAARRGLDLLESQGCSMFQSSNWSNMQLLRQSTGNFAIRTVWGGWSNDVVHGPSLEKAVHVLFNVLYGGCHLAAWDAFFPTKTEKWLWRGSALFLTTVPIWGGLWILWWKGVRSQRRAFYLIRNGDLDIIAGPFFFTILVTYTLARCYFLIESLMSLRRLPSKAYMTVDWTSFLPHVS